MSDLPSALATELAKDRARWFVAVEFNFPGGDVRLLNGSAELTLGGNLFAGEDPVHGSLETIEDITDGVGDEAPGLSITLLPAAGADPAIVASADMQDARVRVSIGAVNEITGLPVSEPFKLLDGIEDIVTLLPGPNRFAVEHQVVGGFERFFEAEEGIRLAPAFYERVWPNNRGLRAVTGIQDNPYWGQNSPNGVSSVAATARSIFAG